MGHDGRGHGNTPGEDEFRALRAQISNYLEHREHLDTELVGELERVLGAIDSMHGAVLLDSERDALRRRAQKAVAAADVAVSQARYQAVRAEFVEEVDQAAPRTPTALSALRSAGPVPPETPAAD